MDDQTLQEITQTALDLSGAPGPEVSGHAVGAVLAVFQELFSRVEQLERIVLRQPLPEPAAEHLAEVVELPLQPPATSFQPPAPDVGSQSQALGSIFGQPQVPTARDELMRQRAEGALQPPASSLQPPMTELERLRSERAALEARLAQMRARQVGQVAPVVPAAAYQGGSQSLLTGQQLPLGFVPSPLQPSNGGFAPQSGHWQPGDPSIWEIRHVEGPLLGRADMVGYPILHTSYETAQHMIGVIVASHPGWRDRLAVFDRRLP